jgi:hypothetical protein
MQTICDPITERIAEDDALALFDPDDGESEAADRLRGIVIRMQEEAHGDSYDEDTDAAWQAVMDHTIETGGEAVAWLRNRLRY